VANKAVFLDRDGTLNVEKEYVHRIEDWEWIPGAIDALVSLKKAGFLVIVVTNQAGIARGYYTDAEVNYLHARINEELKGYDAMIDAFYHCPHHPEFNGECKCRKPMPGMIYQAQLDFGIALERSWFVGDKASDIYAGLSAGVKPILVSTGYGKKERALLSDSIINSTDILEASTLIVSKAVQFSV